MHIYPLKAVSFVPTKFHLIPSSSFKRRSVHYYTHNKSKFPNINSKGAKFPDK